MVCPEPGKEGSPPHARGAPEQALAIDPHVGITPACAGSTLPDLRRYRSTLQIFFTRSHKLLSSNWPVRLPMAGKAPPGGLAPALCRGWGVWFPLNRTTNQSNPIKINWLPVVIVDAERQPLLPGVLIDEQRAAAPRHLDHLGPQAFSDSAVNTPDKHSSGDLQQPLREVTAKSFRARS